MSNAALNPPPGKIDQARSTNLWRRFKMTEGRNDRWRDRPVTRGDAICVAVGWSLAQLFWVMIYG